MQLTITQEFHFAAAHRLPHVPPEHKCARDHGHNYTVVLELGGDDVSTLPRDGMLVDYGVLKAEFGGYLDNKIDHRHLNEIDVWWADNPTAENIAHGLMKTIQDSDWIWARLVNAVTVKEMPQYSATVRCSGWWPLSDGKRITA